MNIIEILPETDDRLKELVIRGSEALDKQAFPGNIWGAESFRQNIINSYDHLFAAVESGWTAEIESDVASAVKSGWTTKEESDGASAVKSGWTTKEESDAASAVESGWTTSIESGWDMETGTDEVLGFAVLRVLDIADVLRISVAEDYRRQGIGRKLLDRMLKKAAIEGAGSVFLEVRASNTPAIRMYEQAGFRTVDIKKGYYEAPIEDAIVMNYQTSIKVSNQSVSFKLKDPTCAKEDNGKDSGDRDIGLWGNYRK